MALITTEAAAAYLGLATSTLEKARVFGTGCRYVKLGRAVRYRISDLDEYLAVRTIGSTSEGSFSADAEASCGC